MSGCPLSIVRRGACCPMSTFSARLPSPAVQLSNCPGRRPPERHFVGDQTGVGRSLLFIGTVCGFIGTAQQCPRQMCCPSAIRFVVVIVTVVAVAAGAAHWRLNASFFFLGGGGHRQTH